MLRAHPPHLRPRRVIRVQDRNAGAGGNNCAPRPATSTAVPTRYHFTAAATKASFVERPWVSLVVGDYKDCDACQPRSAGTRSPSFSTRRLKQGFQDEQKQKPSRLPGVDQRHLAPLCKAQSHSHFPKRTDESSKPTQCPSRDRRDRHTDRPNRSLSWSACHERSKGQSHRGVSCVRVLQSCGDTLQCLNPNAYGALQGCRPETQTALVPQTASVRKVSSVLSL